MDEDKMKKMIPALVVFILSYSCYVNKTESVSEL